MSDQIPDRLSVDPASPYHNAELLQQGVGIHFKGKERFDVEEYSISENWVRVALGKKVDRHGRPLTIKLSGPVEVRLMSADDQASDDQADADKPDADPEA